MLSYEEKFTITNMYKSGMPLKNIANIFNINRRKIYFILNEFSVLAKTKKISKEREIEIITKYINGMKLKDLAQMFEIKSEKIRYVLKKNNITYRHGIRKYHFNQDFFKQINNNSCYWAGFIAADGGIFKNVLAIALNKRDKTHLQKFLKDIGGTQDIKNCAKDIVKISICSKKLVSDLKENFTIKENKSMIIQMPDLDNEELFKHYIRGYFDGDGTVYMNMKNMNICFSIMSGSKQMIYNLQDYISKYVHCMCGIYSYKPNRYILFKGGKEAQKILNWLYKDANTYLDRKFYKYENMLNLREQYFKHRKNGIKPEMAKILISKGV